MTDFSNFLAYIDYIALRRAYNRLNKSIELDGFAEYVHKDVSEQIDADLLRIYVGVTKGSSEGHSKVRFIQKMSEIPSLVPLQLDFEETRFLTLAAPPSLSSLFTVESLKQHDNGIRKFAFYVTCPSYIPLFNNLRGNGSHVTLLISDWTENSQLLLNSCDNAVYLPELASFTVTKPELRTGTDHANVKNPHPSMQNGRPSTLRS